MTPRQLVTKAIELIADPAHWCRGVTARDADGRKVEASSPDAVAFCALGALYRVVGLNGSVDGVATALYNTIAKRGFTNIGQFNDSPRTTHADVLEVLAEVRESLT